MKPRDDVPATHSPSLEASAGISPAESEQSVCG